MNNITYDDIDQYMADEGEDIFEELWQLDASNFGKYLIQRFPDCADYLRTVLDDNGDWFDYANEMNDLGVEEEKLYQALADFANINRELNNTLSDVLGKSW